VTGRKRDAVRLSDILRSTERLEEVLRGGYESFSTSWMRQSAVVFEFQRIGDAAADLSAGLRRQHPEVEWEELRGFAAFAKHEYWSVRAELLWSALEEIPSLRRRVGRVEAGG
jgi:uncharacterized protein with HEPN domain